VSDNGRITWTNDKRLLSDLIPWPRNPRQIKKSQVERLQESIDLFGQVDVIAIGPGNEIYNGHQRLVSWADKYGDIEVDVRISNRELTEKEREKLTVFLHKGAAGEWDFDVLANEFDVDDLLDWGFEEHDLDLDMWGVEPEEDPGAQIDRAEELREKWGVESGQLWKLGSHRLICGDCTDAKTFEMLMGDDKAYQLMTSPPYWVGMEYESQGSIEEIKEFIRSSANAFMPFMEIDKSRVIINTGTGRASSIGDEPETWILLDWWRDALLEHGFKLRHIRVWIKRGGFAMPRGAETDIVDQHWEFIATFYHPKGKKRGQNIIKEPWVQAGYWDDFVGEARQAGHVASFPLELPERCLRLYGEKSELVLEPFSGAGTTIVACERLGRKCRAVEISPAYCAVAIQRWADMTGQEPELVTK